MLRLHGILTRLFAATILAASALSQPTLASDHVDGPITVANPVADIGDMYAFISPQNQNKLVLIQTSYPFVKKRGHFSDRLLYRFRIRPTTLLGHGVDTTFKFDTNEIAIDCTFETPHNKTPHTMHCQTMKRQKVSVKVADQTAAETHGIRAYAGRRSDPFLLSRGWLSDFVLGNCVPKPQPDSALAHINILSIVLELDIKEFFGEDFGPLIGVSSEIRNREDPSQIIDRQARPEITNVHMQRAAGEDDVRDKYNAEDTFALNPEHKALYHERLSNNITHYDLLDGVSDWPQSWKETYINILLDDVLIVDLTKPYSNDGYLAIEKAALRQLPNARSGGRVPGERIINSLATMLVNAGQGSELNDGLAAEPIGKRSFPYLKRPDDGIINWFKRRPAEKVATRIANDARGETVTCD